MQWLAQACATAKKENTLADELLLFICRGFEDAYEDAEDETALEGPAPKAKGGRRRRGGAKSAQRRKSVKRAPQIDQAEAILAAGSNALHMHDTAHGPPAMEKLDAPVPQAVEPRQPHRQEPQAEIF